MYKPLKFVEPPYFDQRIIAQHSLFCCFSSGDIPILDENNTSKKNPCEIEAKYYPPNIKLNDQKPFSEAKDGDINRIYHIDVINKENIRKELNKMGISYLTIYPDMEGLAKHIQWRDLKRYNE